MNSVELSERFCIQHRNIKRIISKVYESMIFADGEITKETYTTSQNKTHDCFDMSDAVIAYLLSSCRLFRSDNARVFESSKILSELNLKHKIVIGDATRQETKFGIMLDEFFGGEIEIVKQYPIMGRNIDFFIPSMNIAIEYDERHHNTIKNKKADIKRMSSISDFYNQKHGTSITWVRVDEGFEIQGIRRVIGAILFIGEEKQLNYFGFTN